MYKDLLNNKIITITGGTGSFGSAFARRLKSFSVKEVRIISRDEKKQDDMRKYINDDRFKFYIGDVRDNDSLSRVIKGTDLLFHAAALKQVPSCEFFPIEAVKTNILGANNVMQLCIEHNVKKCIVLSTDKAVYPINAMGMTKALMEKSMIACSLQSSDTILAATRYGNVIASRGSVIPLFIEQIRNNQSLTITDEQMTRFLMTLDESIDLVLYAMQNASAGEIYVHKAPAANIFTIASAIAKKYNQKLDFIKIGTRHGEKLFESLISREEMLKTSDLGKFYKIKPDSRDLNYKKYFDIGITNISEIDEYTSHNTHQLDVDGVLSILEKINIFEKYDR